METDTSLRAKLWKMRPKMVSPMMTAARPMTMAPRPMLTSAKPWYWLSRAPDKATRPLETIRPSTTLKLVLMPWARLMLGLEPVARMAQPSSVPKNQYSRPISTALIRMTMMTGLCRANSLTQRREISRSYLSTLMDWLDLPMIFRLTEYRASWVRIPARIAGMPMKVCSNPVTRPQARPAMKARIRAVQTFWPVSRAMTQTAPPVPNELSTVRSATSRMR